MRRRGGEERRRGGAGEARQLCSLSRLSLAPANFSKRPYWFHSEFLKSPKTIHLESWLVEAIFGSGRDGERIPHVECISNVLLHVNRWDPKGEAEILIFGRPYYQKDTCKVIMNLADYYRE
uniref:KH domain containing 3 like, subcortical maternal complex member n=1 Tax=Otolemur garnettii TaxID=30611 RepID=H0XUH8_OTOGA